MFILLYMSRFRDIYLADEKQGGSFLRRSMPPQWGIWLSSEMGAARRSVGGYWVNTVVGAGVCSSEITPLLQPLYSQNAQDLVSENQEMIDALRTVSGATDGRGIVVFDRGGAPKELCHELMKDPLMVNHMALFFGWGTI